MRRLPRFFATLVFAAGCVSTDHSAETDKSAEKTIRVTKDSREIKDCKFLGRVQEEDHLGGSQLSQSVAESRATVYMRNKASSMGANTLLLFRSSTNLGGSGELGEAYACPAEPGASPAPARPAAESDPTAKK